MCEISRDEFVDALPYVCEDIRNADFIAFDTEFTGLTLSDNEKSSLFDTGELRYQKLKAGVVKFVPSQIGIAAYRRRGDQNTYMVRTYNFHLYPMSFGPIDVRFSIQASSVEFLCRHHFDFNKFIYDGVPFMNEVQEKLLYKDLESKIGFQGTDRDVDESSLRECCSTVATWVMTASEGDQMEVPGPEAVSDYVVLNELRLRFPETWTTIREDGQILVERMSPEKRESMAEVTCKNEEEKVIQKMLGFTHVFRELVKQKKPIIGHNCLTDLIYMYEKFHRPLPDTFQEFKNEIISLFPHIYDTKHIVNSIRRKFDESLDRSGILKETSLSGLFTSLESEKGQFFMLYSPGSLHDKGFDRYRDTHCPHEAGYDAYMAGKVFLRLAHIVALSGKRSGASTYSMQHIRALDFREHLLACKRFQNRINLIRGSTDCVRLDGADPPSRRPQYLHVCSRKWNAPLNSSLVAQMFSAYGCVDIQMMSKTQAIVALGNHGVLRDIMKNFRNHKMIQVSRYNIFKHSPIVRTALWTGVAVSGGMCIWALWSALSDRQ